MTFGGDPYRLADLPRLIRDAMTEHGRTTRDLAAALGIQQSYVSALRTGHRVPGLALAQRIADELVTPRIASVVVRSRERTCPTCGRVFIDASQTASARFCGHRCQGAHAYRRRRAVDPAVRAAQMDALRLEEHAAAVLAFCRACEPSGLCRDARCELRPVSPLRLAERAAS